MLRTRTFKALKTAYINSRGFKDSHFNGKKEPHEITFLLLGDSCAFGRHGNAYTDQNKISPAILEERLAKNLNKEVNIINTGVPGYSSHEVLLSFRNLKTKFPNDIGVGISKGEEGDQNIKANSFDNPLVNAKQPVFLDRVNQYLTFKSVVYSKTRNLLTGFGKGVMAFPIASLASYGSHRNVLERGPRCVRLDETYIRGANPEPLLKIYP